MLKDLDDEAQKSLAVLDELTFAIEIQPLKEQAKPCEQQELSFVKAERETHPTFFKQLDDLNDVFT